MKNAVTTTPAEKPAQTGPKTAAGKAVSAKNAQKAKIFTQGYLPEENPEQKQYEFDRLAQQWAAYDPSRQIILRTIEQAQLGIERQMRYERQKIEGSMQSADIAQRFAAHAGMSALAATQLPAWFFSESGSEEKAFALEIFKVYQQAHSVKTNYSDQLAAQISKAYPELYAYVMQGQRVTAQFSVVLGQTYRQQTAILNFAKLIEKIETDYRHHIIWASDAERFQTLVLGIRARFIEEAIDLDKSNRYATNLQNRILRGFQALVSLDQLDAKRNELLQNLNPYESGSVIEPKAAPDGRAGIDEAVPEDGNK